MLGNDTNVTKIRDMNAIGRTLQFLALVLLPVAVIMELTGSLGRRGLSDMLVMMLFGMGIFYAGYLLQAHSGNN